MAATGASLCESVKTHEWNAVALSSVAGEVADTALLTALKTVRSVPVWQARAESSCSGLVSGYAQPARMGVDRWLAMLGARSCERRAAVCHRCRHGDYAGSGGGSGQPRRRLHLAGRRFDASGTDGGYRADSGRCAGCAHFKPGSDTQTCVSAGGWRAVIGAVQSVLADYPEHRALLTGGLAPVLLEMGLSATHHPHLVMEGLRLWLLQTLDDQGS